MVPAHARDRAREGEARGDRVALGIVAAELQPCVPEADAHESFQRVDAESAKLIAPAFKQKVTAGKTDAKPEIWSDWKKFKKAIAEYEKAANHLAAVANGKDAAATGLAVKALGESCSGCHESFRKPKEQSYKNQ